MINSKNTFILWAVIIVVLLAGAGFWFWQNKNKTTTPVDVVQTQSDIEVLSPKENQVVTSPLKITGMVKGNGWVGFEGQVGTVTLLDGNGKELGKTFLPAKGEWMQLPTNFEANLEFTAPEKDMGFLIFHNENPSGDPVKDKIFSLPVRFK